MDIIKLSLWGPEFPECASKNCPRRKECANHETDGDFRIEDGETPNLFLIEEEIFCDMTIKGEFGAKLFKNGEFIIRED